VPDILCTLIPGVAGLLFLNSVWLLLLKLNPKPSPAKQERLRQKQELLRRYPELRSTSQTVVTGLGNYFIETVMFAISRKDGNLFLSVPGGLSGNSRCRT
jgi:hypothetical protein